MKKLLLISLLFAFVGVPAAFADEPKTYTEYVIQKHTQKLVDKEKALQAQQKSRDEARAKARLQQQQELEKKLNPLKAKQDEYEAQKKAREDAAAAQKKKMDEKKQLLKQLMSN